MVSKYRESMNAGGETVRSLIGQRRMRFYLTLWVLVGSAAIALVHAYQMHSVIDAVIAVIVFLVLAPLFSWFSLPRTPRSG
jgi:hypothetical protein